MSETPDDGPQRVTRHAPLTGRERRVVVLAALAPVGVAALVLLPVAVLTGASAVDLLGASIVYGGLVGLAAGFVTVDRLQARQCPRCRRRSARRAAVCDGCGYDLELRPRFACDERHAVYLDDGLCDCGLRLKALPTARGVAREVVFMLKLGAWLLAFLFAVALLIQGIERFG